MVVLCSVISGIRYEPPLRSIRTRAERRRAIAIMSPGPFGPNVHSVTYRYGRSFGINVKETGMSNIISAAIGRAGVGIWAWPPSTDKTNHALFPIGTLSVSSLALRTWTSRRDGTCGIIDNCPVMMAAVLLCTEKCKQCPNI